MFIPNDSKYQKAHSGSVSKNKCMFESLNWGDVGIVVCECGLLSSTHLSVLSSELVSGLGKSVSIWFRIFSDIPVTSKPAEVSMGNGKGSVEGWVCSVSENSCIVELSSGLGDNLFYETVSGLVSGVSVNLPVKVKVIKYDG